MNRLMKHAVLAAAVAATSLAALPAAQAGDGWRRHHHHNRNGDLVAAGVLGLAVGAIASGLANSNERDYVDEPDYSYREPVYAYREPVARPRPHRVYYAQQPQYVDGPDVVYAERGGAEPWSRAWFRYCEGRYRTFDARNGTFVGNDGAAHFCIAD